MQRGVVPRGMGKEDRLIITNRDSCEIAQTLKCR